MAQGVVSLPREFQVDDHGQLGPFEHSEKDCFGGVHVGPAVGVPLTVFVDFAFIYYLEIVLPFIFELAQACKSNENKGRLRRGMVVPFHRFCTRAVAREWR